MSRTFAYLFKRYVQNVVILMLGLSLAVLMIDFLQHLHRLGTGANRKVLYLFYRWEDLLALIYPLVLVFALLATQMTMIRRNTFVALLSFGYGRSRLFRPFLVAALGIYLLFTLLQLTPFAYGKDRAEALLGHRGASDRVNELFFKHDDSFVYVRRLDPVARTIEGVRIFEMNGTRVARSVHFESAHFDSGAWLAPEALVRSRVYRGGLLQGFRIKHLKNLRVLRGYRPRIITLIYQGRSLRLTEGLRAWKLLHKQGLDTAKIKATLYNKTLMPLFALAMMAILFFRIPPHRRAMNGERIWALALGATMAVWAFLFALYRMGISATVPPDAGQLPAVALLVAYAWWVYLRERRRETAGMPPMPNPPEPKLR